MKRKPCLHRTQSGIAKRSCLSSFLTFSQPTNGIGDLSRAQAERLLNEAETRMQGLINLPHATALRTAQKYLVSAYDARFLATAENLDTRLVTEDTKLRAAAPSLTQSLVEALSV